LSFLFVSQFKNFSSCNVFIPEICLEQTLTIERKYSSVMERYQFKRD